MKRFQSIIQKYITGHQKHKKYLAAVLALSILVSFAVPLSLIMPAVSMTEAQTKIEQHIHSDECYQISCENTSEEHIHTDECYTLACSESGGIQLLNAENYEEEQEIPEVLEVPVIDSDLSATADVIDEEIDLSNYIMQFDNMAILLNAELTFENGIIHVPDGDDPAADKTNAGIVVLNPKATVLSKGTDYDENGMQLDVYAVQFNMKYNINRECVDAYFLGDNPKADSFSFNMGFDEEWLTDKLYGTNGIVYNGNEEAGTFTIDGDGLVVITFYKDFVNRYDKEQQGISGSFNFKANLRRAHDEDANEDVWIGDAKVEVPVYPYNHSPDIGVEKKVSIDYDMSKKTAEYTIIVKTKEGTSGDITITDTLSSNDDMTFDFADDSDVTLIKSDGTIVNAKVSVNGNKAIITGLPALKKGETYTWKCPVKLKESAKEELDSPNSTKTNVSSQNTVQVSDGKLTANANDGFNKTVKASIDKDGGYESKEDRIKWTVTISNPGGIDLVGYKVSDDLTVTGWAISPDSKGSFDTNGTYTFGSGDNETKYTITYYTDASQEHGNNVTNTANLISPNGAIISKNKTVNVPKQQTVNKSAVYNGTEIEWTITINNEYNRDLKGYTVVDEMFEELGDNNPFSNYGTLSGNTFTFTKSITDSTVTLKYKTTVTDEQKGTSVPNSATLKDGDKEVDTGTTSCQVPKFDVTLGKSGESSVNSSGKGTVKWIVTINNPYGKSLKDTTIFDEKLSTNTEKCKNVKFCTSADGSNIISDAGTLSEGQYKINSDLKETTYYLIYETVVDFNAKSDDSSWTTDDDYSKQFHNTASLGEGGPGATGSAEELPKKHQHLDSKDATFNNEKNEVTWRITITNPYKIPIEDWQDKTVEDDMMEEAQTFKVFYNNNGTMQEISGVSPNGKTFTFTKSMQTSDRYVIEYTTLKNPDNHNEINIAKFNGEEKVKTIGTAPREELIKSLNGNVSDGSDNKITIPWKVSLKYSTNVFSGQTYKDTIDGLFLRNEQSVWINDKETNEVIILDHYITGAQLKGLEVWGKKPGSSALEKINSGYTIKAYTVTKTALADKPGQYNYEYSEPITDLDDDAKYAKFEIKFNESDSWNNYSELELKYSTTGDTSCLTDDDVPLNDKLTFHNDSEFKNNESSNDYQIQKKAALQKYDLTDNSKAASTNHMLSEYTGNTAELKWKIIANESQNYGNNNIVLTDMIPANLTFDKDTSITSFKIGGVEQKPIPDGVTITVREANDKGETPVEITIPKEVHNGKKVEIEYKATISKSELKKLCGTSGIKFENTVTDGKDNSVTQTQTVVDKLYDYSKTLISPAYEFGITHKIGDDDKYLGFTSTASANRQKLTDKNFKYLVDINPYKKDLDENSNTLKITDEMNGVKAWSERYVMPLNIKLLMNTIKVYEVKDNGTVRELENNEYKFDYTNSEFDVGNDYGSNNGSPYETSIHTMYFVIPDEMHVRIEYTYLIDYADGYTQGEGEAGLGIGNAFRFNNDLNWSTVKLENVKFEESSASATAEIQPYIQIEKVEEGHYDVKLARAVFTLEKWDNGKWIKLTDVKQTDKDANDNIYNVAEWNENGNAYQFVTNTSGICSLPLLDDDKTNGDAIYRLTEIGAPTGYYLDSASTVHYFKCGTVDPSNYPEGVSDSDLEKISNQKVTITNAPRSIDVEKMWKNVTRDDATPPVKVQLYRTTSDLILNPKKAHIEVELNIENQFNTPYTHSTETYAFDVDVENSTIPDILLSNVWTEFTSVKEVVDGKEIDLSSGTGTFAQLISDNTAAYNEPKKTISFVNPLEAGKTVKYVVNLRKYAVDNSVKESDTSYRVSVNGKLLESDEREYILPEGTEGEAVLNADGQPWVVTLNDDNYWKYSFTDNTTDHSILPEKDKDGHIYHYFVKETPVPNGFVVSYVGNGTDNGSIQVVNTHNPQNLKVKKEWDNQGHNLPTGIYVQIYKSTNQEATEFTDDDKVGDRVYIIPEEDEELVWEHEWTEEYLRNAITSQKKDGVNVYDADKDSDKNPLTDDNGNPYYFFVEEEPVENYYPAYDNNGIKKGTVTIKNTYNNPVTPPIRLEKSWKDSDDNAKTDTSDIASVQVEVWKATQKVETQAPEVELNGINVNDIPDSNGSVLVSLPSGKTITNIDIKFKFKSVRQSSTTSNQFFALLGSNSWYGMMGLNKETTDNNLNCTISGGGGTPVNVTINSGSATSNVTSGTFYLSGNSIYYYKMYNASEFAFTAIATDSDNKKYELVWNDDKTQLIFSETDNVSSGSDDSGSTTSENPIPEGATKVKTVSLKKGADGVWYTLLEDLPTHEADGSEITYYFKESKVTNQKGEDITSKYTVSYDNNGGIGGVEEVSEQKPQTKVGITNKEKPTGTIQVNKQWLDNEEPENTDGKKSIEFAVYASTEEITPQQPNSYNSGIPDTPPEPEEPETPATSKCHINFTINVGDTEKLKKSFDVNSGNVAFQPIAQWNNIYDYAVSSLKVNNKTYSNMFSFPDSDISVDKNGQLITAINLNITSDTNIVLNLSSNYDYGDLSLSVDGTNVDDLNASAPPVEPPTEEPTEPTTEPTKPDTEKIIYDKVTPNVEGAKLVGTISVIKQEDGTWSGSLGDLPLNDDEGNRLYYYVVEQGDGSGDYVPVSYSGNGVKLARNGISQITVHNQKQESDGVKMPSTGGKGTTWYYITGAVFMLIPVAILIKRRKKTA